MDNFNDDPKPGRLVLPLVLIGMIATTYTFINRVATNNNLDINTSTEETIETTEPEIIEEEVTFISSPGNTPRENASSSPNIIEFAVSKLSLFRLLINS